MDLSEIQRKLEVLSKPLDLDKYIREGLISPYKKTKSKFFVKCNPKEIPEEINLRVTELETINSKIDGSQLVVTLDLKAFK